MERPPTVGDLNWDAERARDLTERMLGIWTEMLDGLDDLPAGRVEPAADVARAMRLPIDEQPLEPEQIETLMRQLVFDHSAMCGHSGFLAYVSGAGTVPGAAADLLAAGLNPNVGGWVLSPAASELELYLMRWMAERFGLPPGSGGLMTSGGATSNLTALKAARDSRATGDTRRDGISERLAIYTSAEAHATIGEAGDLLGLGSRAVRTIPTDERQQMRVDLLEQAIEADIADGVRPIAVAASAGTTATGAVDPLDEIAQVCRHHDLWYHVDAAYGGAAMFAPSLRPLLRGIELADSITFDPHKWLYTPHASGCLLVRDPADLVASYAVHAAYVYEDRDLTGAGTNIGELGPSWSRPFVALKVWMSLAAHGLDAYARRIAHDVELAHYLHAEATRRTELEPMAPVALSIACFRYVPPDLPPGAGRETYLNDLNERLLHEVRRDGQTFPSNAEIGGAYCLRACIVNYRTEADDIDALLDVSVEQGRKLDAALRPSSSLR
jgi:aromatic-L-amino-acid decarboxylase